MTHIFIIDFKREIILSYILNTGYIGTYEPTYKLLYNKKDEYYCDYLVYTSRPLGTGN